MAITSIRSPDTNDIEKQIGDHIRTLRFRKEIDQRDLAAQANISVGALKNLENGKGATLKTLIKVLRVLDRIDWFDALAPRTTISPLDALKQTKQRRRVYAPRKTSSGAIASDPADTGGSDRKVPEMPISGAPSEGTSTAKKDRPDV